MKRVLKCILSNCQFLVELCYDFNSPFMESSESRLVLKGGGSQIGLEPFNFN